MAVATGVESENIKFDEKLSEAVREFPCLYDKSRKDYKDKCVGANAWAKVAEKLDLEEGERAKKLFENLKKRYSKRRNDFKKVSKSGTSSLAVASARRKLEEYNFQQWLDPFITPRTTKTNLSVSSSCSSSTSMETLSTNEEIGDFTQLDDNEFGEVADETFDDNSSDTSATTGNRKWSKAKVDVEEEEIKFLRSFQKAVEQQKGSKNNEKDENELFGMLVASQLKKFSAREQFIARHQIQNVLFNIQMSQDQSHFTNQPMWNNSQPVSLPSSGGKVMQNPTS